MEPWGCFVAEEGDGKIVGAALAVMWGTVGVIGPVAVLTNYQNQDIGQQLLAACQEFFDENKATLQGLATYPYSPKHLVLYQKFGYKPKGLVVVTSKAMDRAEAAAAAARPAPKPGLAVRRYSTLEEARKKQVMQKVRRITNGFWRKTLLPRVFQSARGSVGRPLFGIPPEFASTFLCNVGGVAHETTLGLASGH